MTNENWSEEHVNLLRGNLSNREIAIKTGRSQSAIRAKRERMKIPTPKRKPMPSETSVDEDREHHGNQYWSEQYKALHRKYEEVLKVNTVTDQLVELASKLAPRSYDPAPNVIRDRSRKRGKPQSAVLMLSDTHVGAVIKPSQTLGFGGYDFDIFLRRLKFLEGAVESILRGHISTAVPELVICFGGDMIHGNLNHSAEAAQVNTLFQQFYGAGHALAQFVRNVSPLAPVVRIQTVVGNHCRWGTQKKMPTDNRYSNLDSFLYAYIQALTAGLPNVKWNMDMQPFSLFDVQGFRFHLSHGDHLRGGDKALGIPNHAVGRMVSSTAQLYGKHDLPAPHYYLVGHLHRGIVLPHARGSVIVNGGFPGIDGYALMSGFSPVDPMQTLFMVHPRYGKTATFDLHLKQAPTEGPAPYNIPSCGEPIA